MMNITRLQQDALIRRELDRRNREYYALEMQKLKIIHGRGYKETDAFLELEEIIKYAEHRRAWGL